MLVYWVFLILSGCITTVILGIDSHQEKYRNLQYFLLGIEIFYILVFFGFRNNTGTDYTNYINSFSAIENHGIYSGYEPGWVLLISIFKNIRFSNEIIFFLIACLTLYFHYVGLKKFKFKNPLIGATLIAFFYGITLYMGVIRLAVSSGICIISFYFFLEKKTFKGIFWSLLSVGIHYGSIIPLSLTVLISQLRSKSDFRWYYLILIIGTVTTITVDHLIGINNILFSVIGSANNILAYKLTNYSNYDPEGFKLFTLIKSSVFLIFIALKQKSFTKNQKYLIHLLITGYLLINLLNITQLSHIITRSGSYFTFYEVVLIYQTSFIYTTAYKRQLIRILIIILIIASFYSKLNSMKQYYIPYKNHIWKF